LRVGDLQVRTKDYVSAIGTYERVADFYSKNGFPLKAVAVYKQVRELVQKHASDRASRYGYVVERLTSLYGDLGLVSDALSMLDDEANWLRGQNRESEAVSLYRRMTEISAQNPLPHLRLAEGLCRIGEVDEAMIAFATAADLLVESDRPDDALRVMERMLHFKQDPEIAKTAARIYLDKGSQPEAMQALSRLQICFQADPKDLETLELLALAFEQIGQGSKAFEVRKEIARVAHEHGDAQKFRATLELLREQAPDDQQVQALTQLPPPKRSGGPSAHPRNELPAIPRAPASPSFDSEAPEARASQELETIEELEFLDDSGVELEEFAADDGAAASGALRITDSIPDPGDGAFEQEDADDSRLDGAARDSNVGVSSRPSAPTESSVSVIPLRTKADGDLFSAPPPSSRREPVVPSEPRFVESRPPQSRPAESRPPQSRLPQSRPAESRPPQSRPPQSRPPQSRPAESRPPQSRPSYAPESSRLGTGPISGGPMSDRMDAQAHTKRALTDAAAFRGLRLVDKAIETVQVALEFDPQSIELRECLRDLYVERGDRDAAIEEMLTMAAIYIEYEHSEHATTVLMNVLEAVPEHPVALRTLGQIQRQSGGLSNPPSSIPAASTGAPPMSSSPGRPLGSGPLPRFGQSEDVEEAAGSLEEALEEAEFFASRGLFEDAMLILNDQLDRASGNPLLLEAIREIEEAMSEAAGVGPLSSAAPRAPANGAAGERLRAVEADDDAPRSSAAPNSTKATLVPDADPGPESVARDRVPKTKRSGQDDVSEEFDIRAELGELERVVRESQNPPPPGKRKKKNAVNVDKVFASFKATVRSKVSDHDSSTHYDLGVAYKEMKLFDDAIEELTLAARDGALECNCFSMIGMIRAEQQRWEDASKALTRALGAAQKTPAQEANLYYDLGHAHEQLERIDKASYYFQQALRREPNFRDARERIANLRQKSQPPVSAPAPMALPTATSDDELDRAFEELLGD
jgi:tetratricopeptide (TPR) repeat protein